MPSPADEYEAVSTYLRNHGLEWLASAVDMDIEEGRSVVAKRQIVKEEIRGNVATFAVDDRVTGRLEEFTVAENYTPEERLQLLYEAIRRVLVDPALMEVEITKYLGGAITGVSFVPDVGQTTEDEPHSFDLSAQAKSIERLHLLEQITARLKELRK